MAKTIVRCCANCKYFKPKNTGFNGYCQLPNVLTPGNPDELTNKVLVCDSHIWKSRTKLEELVETYGVEIPP